MFLRRGARVIILTRDPVKAAAEGQASPRLSYAAWDVRAGTIDVAALQQADAIIHLAGAGVMDKRWNDAYKQEIVDSRVKSSALLIKALRENEHKVKTFVSASAIGWYGPDTDVSARLGFSEDAPADPSFLGDTCKQWEDSVAPVEALGIRRVTFRIGIVLSNEGGAFVEFRRPITFGVAAILGRGDQTVSWIHIYDLCHLFEFALDQPELHGTYNAVAPRPVTNKELTKAIAYRLKDNWYIPVRVPTFVLKMMMGESSIEVLKSTTVSCKKIEQAGFKFHLPDIASALDKLIR